MRRRHVLWLLVIPLFSGCTIALEEACQDSMRIFEFSAPSAKSTTVVSCDPVGQSVVR